MLLGSVKAPENTNGCHYHSAVGARLGTKSSIEPVNVPQCRNCYIAVKSDKWMCFPLSFTFVKETQTK